MSVGTCTNCLHSENLPAMYQHFANPRLGGIGQYVGYCPTVEPFWSGGRPTFCQESGAFSATTSPRYGESVGSFSRCILSTATQQGYIQPPEPLGTCRNVYCEEGGLRIQISAENFVYCTPAEVGQRKDVYGQFAGYVLCPSVELLCPGGPSSKPCAFPGTMRHGRCVCAPGFMGADCSVRDLAVNREDYPYGLRYPQQEFVLKAGVPLALTENLAAWPVGPQLLDAPKVLQFRVAPETCPWASHCKMAAS
ncbi:unnamed protein product [Effrenium voratum]|nr:unnamed protein product [Effrenium voratum]